MLNIQEEGKWQNGQATDTSGADHFSDHLSALESHLSSLETRSGALESRNQALGQELAALQALNSSLQETLRNLTAESQRREDDLRTLVNGLHGQNLALAYELNVLRGQVANQSQEDPTPVVSFHVRMSPQDKTAPANGTALVMTDVYNNEGQAYDPATGNFTAPYPGTYCVLASTEPKMDQYAGVYLMVDEQSVDFAETTSHGSYQAMSVHMVMTLKAGQKVWLRSNHDSHFWYSPTTFSGFLVRGQ
ncbi:uncharacterized protein LOC143288742 [Babylonia areolata]|uniref:uncharacterized protein LOC143288742 n=1 Tax=Babylonia areolata TaxID=304850 RepID=UPI003FD5CE7B